MDTPGTGSAPARLTLPQVRQLIEVLPCAAILLDPQGGIAHLNDAAGALLGMPAQDLLGRNLLSLYPDEASRQPLRDSLRQFHQRGELETTLWRADGQQRPVIASFNHVAVADSARGYRLITLVDIFRLKDTEASLKFQQEFLVQMSDTVMQQALSLKELNEKLEQRVQQRTRELHDANMDAIYMLAVAAEAKDHDTGAHVLRIQRYSQALACAIGLNEREADEIGYSSILHDVGKLHVPDHILNKPGPLSDEERRAMEQHTVVGERILSTRPFFGRARRIARSHHENFDGSGYPDGLKGQEIPLEARIVHVADVYDALTSARAYKEAWSVTTAMRMIRESAGTLFDPAIASALAQLHDSGDLRTLTLGFCDFSPK
ncbi:MAG: HD domain-containing protein [Phycisphaerae bacterium]|nr:HD domain-containing protein [Phycisphaerae bacterium]MDW8261359.1 HD domain-containing phosphohydrolase [Phycisphaerales bacterium]